MKFKIAIVFIISLILLTCPVMAISNWFVPSELIWYTQTSIDLGKNLSALALEADYIQLLSTDEIINDMSRDIGISLSGKPLYAYMITFDDPGAVLSLFTDETELHLSDTAQKQLKNRVQSSFLMMLNSSIGNTMVATSSLLTVSERYLVEFDYQQSECIVVLVYPGEYSLGVSFSEPLNRVIGCTAAPINTEMVKNLLAGEAEMELDSMGMKIRPMPLN